MFHFSLRLRDLTQEVYALDLCSWYPMLFSVTSEGEVTVAVICDDTCNNPGVKEQPPVSS